MNKTYKYDLTTAGTVTFTNTYGTDEYEKYKLDTTNLEMLEDLEGVQMATGFASLKTPHIDEYDEYGKVVVPEKNGFAGAHAISIRLYGGDLLGGANQFVTLFPGESLKIDFGNESGIGGPAAGLYYASIVADGLKTEFSGKKPIDPIPYIPNKVNVFDTTADTYLDRGTGVGDEDSINFDSEAYTEEMEDAISA